MTAHQPAGATRRKRWTPAQVRALGVRTDLATLGSILGMSETAARELHRAGRLPAPLVVLSVGRRLVVPVQPILELLGISDGGPGNHQPARDVAEPGPGAHPGQATSAARAQSKRVRPAQGGPGK
jgi:hypothetical protein